jgi:hypothetical protein
MGGKPQRLNYMPENGEVFVLQIQLADRFPLARGGVMRSTF